MAAQAWFAESLGRRVLDDVTDVLEKGVPRHEVLRVFERCTVEVEAEVVRGVVGVRASGAGLPVQDTVEFAFEQTVTCFGMVDELRVEVLERRTVGLVALELGHVGVRGRFDFVLVVECVAFH